MPRLQDAKDHGRPGGWRPLLEGELRAEALAAVEAIAAGLPGPGSLGIPDLARGEAGLALFYCYLSDSRDGGDARRSARHLNHALRAAGAARLPPGLYGGVAGIAWASQHVRSRLTPDAAVEHRQLDEALLAYARRSPWRGDYDLIAGLVGLGVYAVERLPRPAAAALLEAVIDRLAETAVRTEAGAAWHTGPELLPGSEWEACSNRCYNLGVAHGIPGVIALLGRACGAGVAAGKARPLLDGAVRWLLAQRRPAGAGRCFDYWIAPGADARPSRSAWCYGDPGVAAALLLAAASVPDPGWEGEALEVALGAAARPLEQTGVRDAGLCHGAAGVAHLYNRMHQATGEARLGDAARGWFRRTLDFRRPGAGVAGFGPLDPRARPDGVPDESAGLLLGAAGIGLALLAASTPVAPDWDRMLLTSLPPRGGPVQGDRNVRP